jgi:hypothetical protein
MPEQDQVLEVHIKYLLPPRRRATQDEDGKTDLVYVYQCV